MSHKSNGPRFTGRCPCGGKLELAYDEHFERTFFNCFQCFPHFKNLAETGKCTCGRKLEPAWVKETDTPILTCFKCFPIPGIERVGGKKSRTKRK
jgi:hypothetical protein